MLASRRAILALLIGTSPAVAAAQTQSFALPGTANIYGSGSLTPPAPSGGGGGTLPGKYALGAGTGRKIVFSTVTGAWGCCGAGSEAPGPDGNGVSTSITGYNNLSGIKAPSQMFLAAVFLAGGVPSTEPATLDFSAIGLSFSALSPLLGQIFFVGDGKTGTGSGSLQEFFVPDAATDMYLGMADAYAFGGAPGWYDDNPGTLSGTFTESGATSTPEPATFALLTTGLIAIGGVSRRKRRT